MVLGGSSLQGYHVNVSGVYQGSTLNTTLFLLYTDDILHYAICIVIYAADNTVHSWVWLSFWFVGTARLGFWTWIWPERQYGVHILIFLIRKIFIRKWASKTAKP